MKPANFTGQPGRVIMRLKPHKPSRVKSIQRKDNGPIVVTTIYADGKSVTTTNIQPLPSIIRKAMYGI